MNEYYRNRLKGRRKLWLVQIVIGFLIMQALGYVGPLGWIGIGLYVIGALAYLIWW